MAYRDSRSRSIAKAISWRLTGTLATMVIVFFFTRRIELAATIGGIELFGKMFLYFLHERLWNRVHFGKLERKPSVLWFTGLSGAGKSTIADQVHRRLAAEGGKVERLDGDTVRDIFPRTGFTRAERDDHLKKMGFLASRLERNGVCVVASFVSPYQESRDFIRRLCDDFVEIYVATSLEECERRDVKGLYAKARRGEIGSFTGIDEPYEPPRTPELVVETQGKTVDESVDAVMKFLSTRNNRMSVLGNRARS